MVKKEKPALSELEYNALMLSKIAHKKYEYYVISRIIHKLDDNQIEFSTQQLVRGEDGKRYLVDLYFPQFNIGIEVDESYHKNQVAEDSYRERVIVEKTQMQLYRFDCSNRTKEDLDGQIQEFIKMLRTKKVKLKKQGKFIPYDFNKLYNPYAWKGTIKVENRVRLRTHDQVLTLFGIKKKNGDEYVSWEGSLYPKARKSFSSTNNPGEHYIWFPKVYSNNDWENQLYEDENILVQRSKKSKELEKNKDNKPSAGNYEQFMTGNIVIFVHQKDDFGTTAYEFKGVFRKRPHSMGSEEIIFERISDSINLKEFVDWIKEK